MTASENQAVDGDTNEPTRPVIPNDTPAAAQPLSNPVTLGGHVNRPGSGPPGRTSATGDIDDFFSVQLLAGQRITLVVADFETADADLYLLDAQGEIIDFSVDTGQVETLLIGEDGDFFVNVTAFAGATNYILAIGTPDPPVPTAVAQRDVVPWEAVVHYREQAGKLLDAQSMDHGLGLRQRGGDRGRARLMALNSRGVTAQQQRRRLGAGVSKLSAIHDAALRARWETLLAIKALRDDPLVELAEPNFRVHSLAIPNDEAFPLQWHYPLISLPEAWDTTIGSEDIVVAVIDTGVLPEHPDLAGQFAPGFDFVRNVENAGDGDGIDPNPRDPGSTRGGTGSFHGTHVSGTVVARGDNGIGVAGVAYGARVMPLRALGVNGGTTFDVDQALRFAAGLPNDSGTLPERPAAIVNMSLGSSQFSQSSQNLINEVRARGVIVVAAAGNEASSQPSYPAAYDGVISVSAVDSQRRLAFYSNIGPSIDVAAPGGDNGVDLTGDGFPDGILSTGGVAGDSGPLFVNSFLSGTSMAAPHVAGVLALMKSVNPALTPGDVDALLSQGSLTLDLGTPGRDERFGHGLINAQRAVLAALESIGSSPVDNPRLLASQSTLNFGSSTTALTLSLRNGGEGELALESIAVSEPWLQVQPLAIDAAGLGDYRVLVDRDGLAAGSFAADITAVSSVNALSIRVFLFVGTGSADSDVGVLFALLIDAASNEVVAQAVSDGAGGRYDFRFENIEAGTYEVAAGSDADNDLFICDAGEACGAWLTLDRPVLIELTGDREGLDFPVEYQVALPTVSTGASDGGSPGIPRTTGMAPPREGTARLPTATQAP